MNARQSLALFAAAGVAASARAQERISVTYSWSEVVSGTTTPVPAPNSILEPGEGAYIRLNIFANIGGMNAIGQTTTISPPPGFGTIAGTSFISYSLYGTGSDATGSWSGRAVSPVLSAGAFLGNISQGGASVEDFGGAQSVPQGSTANPLNPLPDVFRGVWNPSSYLTRTVHFQADIGHLGSNQYSGFLVKYGTAFVDPNDPTTEYPLYYTKIVGQAYGVGFGIPISPAPAPPASTFLAAAALWIHRRRRSR